MAYPSSLWRDALSETTLDYISLAVHEKVSMDWKLSLQDRKGKQGIRKQVCKKIDKMSEEWL